MKLLFTFLILFLTVCTAQAQTGGTPFNERDNTYRVLGLKRAKEAFEFSRAEFDRQQILFDKNLISRQELDRAKATYSDAEVNYFQSMLAVLFEKQYVTVARAVKYQSKDGKKHVKITLENSSGGGGDYKKLLNIDSDFYTSLQPDIINDVYVSLLNNENAIISQPYEVKIEELKFGRPVTLDFTLLQDVEAVVVNLVYSGGTQRSPRIYLQKDESENKVFIQSEQFAQEGMLGGSANFSMQLENFSGEDNTFKLEVVNLPTSMNRFFSDPSSNARISQFRFTESARARKANLWVYLPDRQVEGITIDQQIPFYVLAIPQKLANEVGDVRNKIWTQDEIEKLNIGYIRLEIIPRGTGKLLVRAPQLYYSIHSNEKSTIKIDLVNDGTQKLNNIKVQLDVPLNWQRNSEPIIIKELAVGEEKTIELSVIPKENVAVGKYEIRIRSTSLSYDQPVNGDDKTITVEIIGDSNPWGIGFMVFLVVGLIGGMVVFGIKLTRK